MKKVFISLIFVFSFSAVLAIGGNEGVFSDIKPEPQHKRASQLITHILTTNHYKKKVIDDSLSSEIFNRFLKKLDYNRQYFLNSDIESFRKYRYEFDNFIKNGTINVPYEIFNIYQQRVTERLDHVFQRLEHEFDYSLDEYYTVDRGEIPWANSKSELDDLWRKRLKAAALSLKLAGKEWEEISETLNKRYKRIKKNVLQFQSEDVFQIIMNSFTEAFDPHTNYFSPKNFDNFKISMSQSFEGIGARLLAEDDYTKVSDIIAGGPADKGKRLFPNDKIIGVAQGNDGEIIDVIGWRLDDVVQLIRGKKGSVVRLQILAAEDAVGFPPDTISITRDKIKLKDQTARSDTLEIEYEERKLTFGIITIPTFYSDFEGRRNGETDYKSTSRDVEILLKELQSASVDGIVIDLRRNGGGFLNEAVDLTGLFIDKGPVVQVRNNKGKINVEWDPKSGLIYDGPLAVLINRFSASASEIFAAAIQDYGRGVIVGDQSFGKGTVQRPIDLNQILRNKDKKFGQIKLTTAKFYRVNGGSTQHVGVTPDITFPSRFSYMEVGESSRKNALQWDKINSMNYMAFENNKFNLTDLEKRHELRMTNNADYKDFLEKLSEFEKQTMEKTISLNEDFRKKEREESKKKSSTDKSEENKDKKDILLDECVHVLGDYILLSQKK